MEEIEICVLHPLPAGYGAHGDQNEADPSDEWRDAPISRLRAEFEVEQLLCQQPPICGQFNDSLAQNLELGTQCADRRF